MTLFNAILKKVKSNDSLRKKLSSPPPEIDEDIILKSKKKKYVYKYAYASTRVDSRSPRLDSALICRHLPKWSHRLRDLYSENLLIVMKIKQQHYLRGRVDCRWKQLPPRQTQYENNRVDFLKRTDKENYYLYKRILNTSARVIPTSTLHRDWLRNRRAIIENAQAKFILFPSMPQEDIEDLGFVPPPGIKRPRVYLRIRLRGGADLGELLLELFTDVCPLTCKLFLELVCGDYNGYGYVGTSFFRKVPNLYWSGGDVIYDNGFGCYAQRGRLKPIGAENYHFPHSMPGLVSMRMTKDNEMCGIFNITFKPLPQFDLRNVVFGRIIRPCSTYESIRDVGSALSSHPVVEIIATRHRDVLDHRWRYGLPNTKLRTRA